MTTIDTGRSQGNDSTTNETRTKLVLILGGLAAFGPMSIDMYLPSFPSIAGELQTSSAQVQLTLTACILGLALGQLIVGPLSDTLGRRRPLVFGLALYVLGSLACAVAPAAPALMLFRFLQGAGGGAGIVIARAAVRDRYAGDALAKFFSLLMLVNGLAPILAPVIGSQLLNFTSWRGVFVVLSVFGVLLLTVSLLALPETLPAERRTPGSLGGTLRIYRGLLRDRLFVGYLAASGLYFAGLFTYVSGGSFVLQEIYGLSASQFSLAFATNSVGIVLLGQLNGWLVGRVKLRTLLMTGLGVGMLGATLLVLATAFGLGLPAVLPSLFLVVASIGLVMPNATALALTNYPNAAGSASALLGVGQFVFGGLAAPLTGLVGGASAVPMALIMFVLVGCALAATLLTRARRLSPR